MKKTFEEMLSGGHPNSLGRTVEVVEVVLNDNERLSELFDCYGSEDEVVRLRVSNAMKRLAREDYNLVLPLVPKFISKVSKINQPSAQWTVAQILLMYETDLTKVQKQKAKNILLDYLATSDDWIVLNQCIETLGEWAREDGELEKALTPKLKKFAKDERKSVARRAAKKLETLK